MNPIRRIYTFFHKNLLTKTMAIGVVLALMGTTCLIQLANIQLVNGKGMAQAAAQSRTTTVTLKARRGKIMDTNGAILAQSVERYTIIGNPEQAQATYRRGLSAHPDNPALRSNLGLSLSLSGKPREAAPPANNAMAAALAKLRR